jgi:hypothetical protein
MPVTFPQDVLPVATRAGTLAFLAIVGNGKKVACEISVDALLDPFGARSVASRDLCVAFEANRAAIQRRAIEALALNGGESILLRRDHF